MPPSKPVNITSSSQWSGNFDCSGPCRRKRLLGEEFSKKAMEKYRREGKALKCKQCVAAAEAAERKAAQDRAEAKAKACGDDSGEKKVKSGSTCMASGGDGASSPPPLQPPVTCAACQQSLPPSSYNRNQLSKPPGKARCRSCVEEAVAKEAEAVKSTKQDRLGKAQRDLEDAKRSGDTKKIIAAESVLAALEAEVVTGLKPVVLGKGRGKGGRWSSGRGGATGSGRGRGRGRR